MYAFWKYDLYPFLLGGRVTGRRGESVLVDGSSVSYVPMFEVKDSQGEALKASLERLREENRAEKEKIRHDFQERLRALMLENGFESQEPDGYLPKYHAVTVR